MKGLTDMHWHMGGAKKALRGPGSNPGQRGRLGCHPELSHDTFDKIFYVQGMEAEESPKSGEHAALDG